MQVLKLSDSEEHRCEDADDKAPVAAAPSCWWTTVLGPMTESTARFAMADPVPNAIPCMMVDPMEPNIPDDPDWGWEIGAAVGYEGADDAAGARDDELVDGEAVDEEEREGVEDGFFPKKPPLDLEEDFDERAIFFLCISPFFV